MDAERLKAENERLRAALTGAWLEYDAIPYQMATPEYDRLRIGYLTNDEGAGPLFQMDAEAVEEVARWEQYRNHRLLGR